MGWILTAQRGNAQISSLPANKWPWQWTYAIVLQDRWRQVQDLAVLDQDEAQFGVPPEIWHDQLRVDNWIEEQKRKRQEKQDYNA